MKKIIALVLLIAIVAVVYKVMTAEVGADIEA